MPLAHVRHTEACRTALICATDEEISLVFRYGRTQGMARPSCSHEHFFLFQTLFYYSKISILYLLKILVAQASNFSVYFIFPWIKHLSNASQERATE
jgi:hypothetical protein